MANKDESMTPKPNPQDVPENQPTQSGGPDTADEKIAPATLETSSIEVDGDAACAVRKTEAKELARRLLTLLATPFVLLLVLYGQTIYSLSNVWMKDDNYSHGFFIPIFSCMFALMAWQRREESKTEPLPALEGIETSDVIGGAIELAAALAIHMFALVGGILILDVVALCIALGAILRIVGGMDLKKLFRFPVWFLIFMAPLPGKIYEPLARALQLTAAKVATFVFDVVFNEPVFREGYVIKLRSETMQVGAACSGIRSLTAIIALSFVVGFFMNRSKLFRWILILSSPFIAIGTNCLRVVITGFIMTRIGREWAQGTWHEAEGMVLIGLGAILTIGWAILLAKIEDSIMKPAPAEAGEAESSEENITEATESVDSETE